jgi:hypothetical protein
MSGILQPSVSRIIEQCLDFTLGLAPSVIKFPESLADFNNVKQTFYNSSRFPNALGIIDGSQIPLLAPREDKAT